MDLKRLVQHVDFSNPVSWIALWGAILATINTVMALVHKARDRGRLRVTAAIGTIPLMTGGAHGQSEPLVLLTLVNEGTKPVHLDHVGGERRKGLSPGGFIVFEGSGKQKLDPASP